MTMRQNRTLTIRQLQKRADEERAKALQEKLDEFYGPLIQLRDTSRLLYRIFASRQKDPENFRTLTALLAGEVFTDNNKVLLDEIIKIGEETEHLILKSSGLVDEDLQPILGEATTHYRILRLAAEGMLKGEAGGLADHVFPRDLDTSIAKKVSEIRQNIEKLLTVATN